MEKLNFYQENFKKSSLSLALLERVSKTELFIVDNCKIYEFLFPKFGYYIEDYTSIMENYFSKDRIKDIIETKQLFSNLNKDSNFIKEYLVPIKDTLGKNKSLLIFNKYASKLKKRNRNNYEYLNVFDSMTQLNKILNILLLNNDLDILYTKDLDKYELSLITNKTHYRCFYKYYDNDKYENITDFLLSYYNII